MTTEKFDIIIIGAGLSGLSLLLRLIEDGKQDRKILLVDKISKNRNDKTWSFWEKGDGYFENLVHHQWHNLWFRHPAGNRQLDAAPYRYKMIRSIDFYEHCFKVIRSAANVTVVYDAVTEIEAAAGRVVCNERVFTADYLFSSVLLQPPVLRKNDLYLLQHFMGWWMETDHDFFDADTAQLMNFRVSQAQGCTFVYVLPVSARRALVEYTLFSEETLPDKNYEQGLETFIRQELQLSRYTITEKEKGIIPMTSLRFPQQTGRLFYIGTAGGQTKASTGYTFQFIQKQSAAIAAKLAAGEVPLVTTGAARFHFYDQILLRVLHERKIPGADVFDRMFRLNKASQVLKFLDNETHFGEELRIMNRAAKRIFFPAAIRQLLGQSYDPRHPSGSDTPENGE